LSSIYSSEKAWAGDLKAFFVEGDLKGRAYLTSLRLHAMLQIIRFM